MKNSKAKTDFEHNPNEKFINKNIGELCKDYDQIHGANINLARITPDLIDGLKPVQRRALYITFLKDKGEKFRKLATISGDVFGRVHPHAPTAISDAIAGLEQEWHNSIPLYEGDGNWGTISGDPVGADRYIKARLSKYATACFFEDWKYSVVDMVMGYDEETKEPIYLPAKYPNVLLNGCLGIGYGMASNIPPFNFKEIADATILLMTNPDAQITLIPDSPTGADIIESDFAKMCDCGSGKYTMRCKYDIDPENNIITITNLPYMVTANDIRSKIADVKSNGGLDKLDSMNDLSGNDIKIELIIQDDVNPYKFMKKLIKEVPGLEKTYPINISIVDDLQTFDYSIKMVLLEWIRWRKEQKRTVMTHKRSSLLADQRTNDVKIFIMDGSRLDDVVHLFRSSKNRVEIEKRLIEEYRDSEIRMDSLQARELAKMPLYELTTDEHDKCLKERERIARDLEEVETILKEDHGIEKLIVAELRDGVKRFGSPRRSNVVPYKISVGSENAGVSTLQLSSDGMIIRKLATNVYEEPIPTDSNGFAVRVENDESFIIIDENGYHTFVKVKEIPFDSEVPVNRYGKNNINGNIVAMLPFDIDSNYSCTLISRKGMLKKFRISDMKPSKKPFISLDDGDKLVRGIITKIKSDKDLLIYTKYGMGQRLDPNGIRITSPTAKGTYGFKLKGDDEIVGCYAISPEENQYLLYVTMKGKVRLNLIDYLPTRESKHDAMVNLISIPDRDRLLAIVGCNKLDKVQVFFDNGEDEVIEVEHIEESTMGAEPKKVTKQNAVTTNIVKVKLV